MSARLARKSHYEIPFLSARLVRRESCYEICLRDSREANLTTKFVCETREKVSLQNFISVCETRKKRVLLQNCLRDLREASLTTNFVCKTREKVLLRNSISFCETRKKQVLLRNLSARLPRSESHYELSLRDLRESLATKFHFCLRDS